MLHVRPARGYHDRVEGAAPLVLVVASDDARRAAHVAALRRWALRTVEAGSGAGAVRRLRRTSDVALIVVDDDVGYAGWLPIARFVANAVECARIPIAIVTTRPEARAIARLLGMLPVGAPVPASIVHRLLSGHGPARGPGRPPVPRLLLH